MSAVIGAPVREPWPALLDAASRPYLKRGRFAWGFARGKLGRDPVFRHLLAHGLIAPRARVLDIGCGQGLLASLLRAGHGLSQQGRWPNDWAAAPDAVRVTGIELAPGDVDCARASLGSDGVEFVCGDMRSTPFPEADVAVLLDVLHYVGLADQNAVLAKVRRALSPGGVLLLRVADATFSRRFAFSRWVDAAVMLVRHRRVLPQSGRVLPEWIAQLESLGFEVRSQPMSQGTPFANVLLVARVASR
jgi:SAM-dependent methyltransferase